MHLSEHSVVYVEHFLIYIGIYPEYLGIRELQQTFVCLYMIVPIGTIYLLKSFCHVVGRQTKLYLILSDGTFASDVIVLQNYNVVSQKNKFVVNSVRIPVNTVVKLRGLNIVFDSPRSRMINRAPSQV